MSNKYEGILPKTDKPSVNIETQETGFDWNRLNAALRFLSAIKPWWSAYSQRAKFVPISVPSDDGRPYGAITAIDKDMVVYIDTRFVRTSPIEQIAGAVEREFRLHTHSVWNRLRDLDEEEWERWANICFDMEVSSAIREEAELLMKAPEAVEGLNDVALRSFLASHGISTKKDEDVEIPSSFDLRLSAMQGVFSPEDVERYEIAGPPVPPEGWEPTDYGMPSGKSAEEYLEIIRSSEEEDEDDEDDSGEEDGDEEAPEEDQDQDEEASEDDSEEEDDDSDEHETDEDQAGSDEEQEDGEDSGEDEESDGEGADDSDEDEEEVDGGSEDETEDGEGSEESEEEDSEEAEDGSESAQEDEGKDSDAESDPDAQDDAESGDEAEDGEESDEEGDEDGDSDDSEPGDDSEGDADDDSEGEEGDEDSEGGDSEDGEGDEQESEDGEPSDAGGSIAEQIEADRSDDELKEWIAQSLENEDDPLGHQYWKPERDEEDFEETTQQDREDALDDFQDKFDTFTQTAEFSSSDADSSETSAERKRNRRTDWATRLNQMVRNKNSQVQTGGLSDISYLRRNPNQAMIGPILPGMIEHKAITYGLLDVSFSMRRLFADAVNVFADISEQVFTDAGIMPTWFMGDEKIISVGDFSNWNHIKSNAFNKDMFKGGTNFIEIMQMICAGKVVFDGKRYPAPDILVVLTDMQMEFPEQRISSGRTEFIFASVLPYVDEEKRSRYGMGVNKFRTVNRFIPPWLNLKSDFVYVGEPL